MERVFYKRLVTELLFSHVILEIREREGDRELGIFSICLENNKK